MSFQLSLRVLSLAASVDRYNQSQRQARTEQYISDPFEMPNVLFIKTYRLTKPMVQNLIRTLSPVIPKLKRRDALSVKEKVLIALAFYATGSYQTLVGQSKYHCVKERDVIKRRFYRKFKLPGVLGCIDGTHVAIIRPNQHEERYFNRKGYHSLNVMVICYADLNIICIDPSKPGATHDSTVWRDHPLQRYLNQVYNEEEVFLLGDSGYSLRKTLITPILNTEPGSPEEHFHKLHMTARNTVERCIGVMKARFRCLLNARVLHYDPVFAGEIVNACAVLHNITNQNRLPVPNLSAWDREIEEQLTVRRRALERGLNISSDISRQEQGNRRPNLDLLEGQTVQRALINRLWQQRET
ncbi:unnamed protein product [Leptosia nina]|uniref:DDE Tnp4 domain-containing protein n=1 Tax=Leptosia nina TaxID=320188 RepID=A0AAV1JHS4_9NEOP